MLSLAGCLSWQPSNGAYFSFTNRTDSALVLLLEDAPRDVVRDGMTMRVSRLYPKGKLNAHETKFFQWPFAENRGRWHIVRGADTLTAEWVRPWDKMQWWVDLYAQGYTVRWEDRR
jgi:hypothetical protein